MKYKIEHRSEMFLIRLAPGQYSYLKYRVEGGMLKILSIFTPPSFRGRGLAALLMKTAIDYAESRDMRIIPECEYAKDYLEKRKLP